MRSREGDGTAGRRRRRGEAAIASRAGVLLPADRWTRSCRGPAGPEHGTQQGPAGGGGPLASRTIPARGACMTPTSWIGAVEERCSRVAVLFRSEEI
jgi:hypothetical protein